MDTLPYELLTDVFKMVTYIDHNKCTQSSKFIRYISLLVSHQSVILRDYNGVSKYNNAIYCVRDVPLPNNVVYLKAIRYNIASRKLRFLQIFRDSDSDDNYIGQYYPNLTHLSGTKLTFHFPLSLPKSLIYLKLNCYLSSNFDEDIAKLSHLKYLKIGIIGWPRSLISFEHSNALTHLTLNNNFTNMINIWPRNLTYLKTHKNRDLVLPLSLTYLIIEHFTYIIEGVLSRYEELDLPHLRYLEITNIDAHQYPIFNAPNIKIYYYRHITFKENLESLTIINTIFKCLKLPSSLKRLSLCGYLFDIGEALLDSIAKLKLTHLKLRNDTVCEGQFVYWLNKVELPDLTHLSVFSGAHDIIRLPSNLTHVKLLNNGIGRITCLSNSKITHFISSYFNPLDNFPETLTHLKTHLTSSLSYVFPQSLKMMNIRKYENNIIPDLPNNLTHLIACCLNRQDKITMETKIMNKSKLPKSLKYLVAPYEQFSDIPKSIKIVVLY